MAIPHRPSVGPEKIPYYAGFKAHEALMEKNHFKQTAGLLRLYEEDRIRQAKAIKNLEKQLSQLADEHRKAMAVITIIKRSGIDPETIIETDRVFE